MNDDAKFFFFLSGFFGFVFFFMLSIFIDSDPLHALLKGSAGCLIFGMSGRYMLGFALRHSVCGNVVRNSVTDTTDHGSSEIVKGSDVEDSFQDSKNLDQLAAATNLEAVNRNKVATNLKV